jgi:MFS family permease
LNISPKDAKRDYWLIRLYYLIWLGGGGFLFPYISLFYKQQGLSGTEMGLLSAVGWTVALAVAPFMGRLGDNLRNPRRLIQVGLLGAAALYLWLSQQTAFLWMALIIGVDSLINSASDPLSTSQALAISKGDKTGFGSVRVWGSIGWVFMTPLCGWLIERTGLFSMFEGFALMSVLSVVVLQFMVTNPPPHKASDAPQLALRSVLQRLSHDRSMVGLAAALLIFWLAGYGASQFETIYLNQLGASTAIIGVVNTIGAVIEIGGMFWADRLVRRYGSGRVLAVSMLIYAAGKLIVLLAPSVAAIFVMRALSGVYYSLYVVSSIAYTAEGSPAGQGSTVMALYFVTLQGLTQLVAGPLGGAGFDAFGAYWLFAIAVGGGLLSWIILSLTGRSRSPAVPA